MSDSYILLLAQLSKPVDLGLDLMQTFSSTLSGKFEGEENPIRSVLLLSPQSGIVWARGLSVSEFLVSKPFDLGDSLSVEFEFPRSQPSFLVEIVPKKKNSPLDLKKFQSVFDSLKGSYNGAVVVLLSEFRVVVKFADPEEAVKQCASFIDPMKEDGVQTITSRTILIKEHVVMRAFYVGGSQAFSEFERSHKQLHNQSTTDFLNSKFSHFKDRPVVLTMQALPVSTEKIDFGDQASEEVNIACATHYDYRLLRNSPPVSFPGTGGNLVLRVNLEAKIRKSAAALPSPVPSEASVPSAPVSVSGPPALAPPPNLPHPTSTSTTSGASSSLSTAAAAQSASSTSHAPVAANAYIFWDYGSCPVDDEISSPEDLDGAMVGTMAANIRGVVDRYAQFRKDTGHPVKINGCYRHVFAPQGNSFKNIERIPPTWGSFTKNEFKVHHYSKKCSADALIRSVLEGILKQSRPSDGPLLLCFVTNDPEFASIAAYLKLESQNDIILVHNSAQNTVTSLVRKHYSWNMVQDVAKNRKAVTEGGSKKGKAKNDATASGSAKEAKDSREGNKKQEKLPTQDARGRDGGRSGREAPAAPSSRSRRELEPGEELEEGEVSDSGMMVIPPGKELVPWSAGDDASSGLFAFGIEEDPDLNLSKKSLRDGTSSATVNKGDKGDTGGGRNKREEISKTLSSSASVDGDDIAGRRGGRDGRGDRGDRGDKGDGEANQKHDLKYASVATYVKRLMHWRRTLDDEQNLPPRNYLLGEDTTDYDEDLALVCFLRVEVNPKIKRFTLHIRGPSAVLVEQRFQRIKTMIDDCIRVRQSHNFNHWSAEQRTALIGSEVLALQEKSCRAVVLFHYSGATTVAEIVALRPAQHNALLKFVQKLRPKESTIKVPYAFVCWYDADMWEKMRCAFAVKAEVTGEDNRPIKVKTGYVSPEDADAMVNIKLWGFAPKLLDRAIEHIKLNDEREEIRAVDLTDEALAAQAAAAMNSASSAKSGRDRDRDRGEKGGDKNSGRSVLVASTASGPPAVQAAGLVATREDLARRASPVDDHPLSSASGSSKSRLEDSGSGSGSVHKAVYTFADREAGIYFYSFDVAFREFLDKTFSVYVDEAEHAAQLNIMNSGADFKSETLKITLYGSVLKNVQAARAYMDQFNTNVLGRHRVFFPRVSARKYKEIFNKKAAQVQKMLNMRTREVVIDTTRAKTDPVDPLKVAGFVNIRSKPAMLVNSKVTFPTDITITICGPMLTPDGKAMLEQNKIAFNSIPSEFSVATIVIPPTHHMKQSLTLKAEREELVKRFNLVSLRWEEGLKASGNVGTVKIWAYTKASLKIILQEIFRQDMGGAPAQHAPEDHDSYFTSTITSSSSTGGSGAPSPLPPHQSAFASASVPQSASSAAYVHGPPSSSLATPLSGSMSSSVPVPLHVPLPSPVPVTNGMHANNSYGGGLSVTPPPPGMYGQPSSQGPYSPAPPTLPHPSHPPHPQHPQHSSSASAAITTGAMLAGNAKIFASAKGAIKPLERISPVPPVDPNQAKVVVRLPDLSLRFVMQGEPLKSKLNEVLQRLLKSGVAVAYPYKDRTDVHACFELDGEIHAVSRAAEELNDFIMRATRSLRVVQVLVNNEQYHAFTDGGEGIATGTNPFVTEFQAAHGVHCVFNPPTAINREAFSLVDFRLASELVRNKDGADPFLDAPLDLSLSPTKAKVDKEMMSVSVYNCYSQRSVEISIISSNSSETGWTWGVNNLLLLVGSNTLGYSPAEVEQLNRNEVLVHCDRLTGKTILRIRPNPHTRGVNYQAAVLTNALLKCLQKANELGLKGLAISAPTDIDAFPDLTPELIRSLTVEAVVEFSKKCRSYLRFTRLVCIELGYNTVTMNAAIEHAATPQVPAAMVALERRIEPAQKDRMVRTLAMLIERHENEHNDEVLASTYETAKHGYPHQHQQQQAQATAAAAAARGEVRSKMSILTCNVPLPVQLLPALASHERSRGFKVFLVKGLLSSVVKSLDAIKTKLAAPKPMELDLPFDVNEFF